jgi:hypothetical protein
VTTHEHTIRARSSRLGDPPGRRTADVGDLARGAGDPRPPHLRRTVVIALVVGTILFCINQLDVVLQGEPDAMVWIKSAVTYIVPFCVSCAGVLAATRRSPVEPGPVGNRARLSDDAWSDYLAAFHRERPGITEAVLARARAEDGRDPYDWVAEALHGDDVIVDVACGSGPLASRTSGVWFGLDRSWGEVRLAATVAPGRVGLADAARVPVRAHRAGPSSLRWRSWSSATRTRPWPRWRASCPPVGAWLRSSPPLHR